MTLEELVNFNARAGFVGEKLDEITLFNRPNNALLADRWDGYIVICARTENIKRTLTHNQWQM
jgi:hypothetical protein